MQDFQDKVAVVTGGGSGIGRALALACAHKGMKIVLADIDEGNLTKVAQELTAVGATVKTVTTNVARHADIQRVADETMAAFGTVHLLFNNAGVSGVTSPIWEHTLPDWDWVLGVNLMGVIYGVQTFVPLMLAHEEPAHIVNTASIAGLMSGSGLGGYSVTKHAVVSLSETLFLDLKRINANIGVSVLCPAWVKTNIAFSRKHRPDELNNEGGDREMTDIDKQVQGAVISAIRSGISADEVAQAVFEAIENQKFYILTHPPYKKLIQRRFEGIMNETGPTDSWE